MSYENLINLLKVAENIEIIDERKVENKLQEFGLDINEEKSGIASAYSVPYLGYCFEKYADKVVVKRQKKKIKKYMV